MSDRYQQLVNTPVGKIVSKQIGLPDARSSSSATSPARRSSAARCCSGPRRAGVTGAEAKATPRS